MYKTWSKLYRTFDNWTDIIYHLFYWFTRWKEFDLEVWKKKTLLRISQNLWNWRSLHSRKEWEDLFDNQLRKPINLVHAQLKALPDKYPHVQVVRVWLLMEKPFRLAKAHLIPSGGSGHSVYVKEKLKSHSFGQPNANGMQICRAPRYQLAVCKRLVANRVRQNNNEKNVFKWRCCRALDDTLCMKRSGKNVIKLWWASYTFKSHEWSSIFYSMDCLVHKTGKPHLRR